MVGGAERSGAPFPSDPLARVCDLLNRQGARYVVVGAQACILHGLVRTTEDVDLLIEESDDNYARVLRALFFSADFCNRRPRASEDER